MRLPPLAVAAGFAMAVLTACAPAEQVRVESPLIEMPRTPGGVAAAYFTITVSQSDRIVGVSSPQARTIEMHKSVIEAGLSKMQRQEAVDLPANSKVAFAPGGLHLMVFDPSPIEAAATFPITIELESGLKKLVAFVPADGSVHGGHH